MSNCSKCWASSLCRTNSKDKCMRQMSFNTRRYFNINCFIWHYDDSFFSQLLNIVKLLWINKFVKNVWINKFAVDRVKCQPMCVRWHAAQSNTSIFVVLICSMFDGSERNSNIDCFNDLYQENMNEKISPSITHASSIHQTMIICLNYFIHSLEWPCVKRERERAKK